MYLYQYLLTCTKRALGYKHTACLSWSHFLQTFVTYSVISIHPLPTFTATHLHYAHILQTKLTPLPNPIPSTPLHIILHTHTLNTYRHSFCTTISALDTHPFLLHTFHFEYIFPLIPHTHFISRKHSLSQVRGGNTQPRALPLVNKTQGKDGVSLFSVEVSILPVNTTKC